MFGCHISNLAKQILQQDKRIPQINLKLIMMKTEQDYSIIYMDSTIFGHVYETFVSEFML